MDNLIILYCIGVRLAYILKLNLMNKVRRSLNLNANESLSVLRGETPCLRAGTLSVSKLLTEGVLKIFVKVIKFLLGKIKLYFYIMPVRYSYVLTNEKLLTIIIRAIKICNRMLTKVNLLTIRIKITRICGRALMNVKIRNIFKKMYNYVFVNALLHILYKNDNIDSILQFMRSRGRFAKYMPIDQFYTNLFLYTKKQEQCIPIFEEKNGKRNYIIYLSVWGEEYVNKMLTYLIPSLLSPNNIPAFADKFNILFWVHLDQCSYEQAQSSLVVKKLSKCVTIRYDVIPQQIFKLWDDAKNVWLIKYILYLSNRHAMWKYNLLGCLDSLAMQAAKKNNALISFVMPDLLFSDGAFSNLLTEVVNKKRVGLATAFRTSFPKIKKCIDIYRNGIGLDIPGEKLSGLMVENMHESAQSRIVATSNKFFNLTPQLIFSYHDEVVIRSIHYHPFLVDFATIKKDVPISYLPIDNWLLSYIIDDDVTLEEQIWANDDAQYVGVMELSDDGVEPINECAEIKRIIDMVKDYVTLPSWSRANLFLLAKRYKYKLIGKNSNLISDVSDMALIPTDL